jgi:hypothetical protein
MEHRSTLHRGVSLHLGNDKKNSLALVARRELFPGQAEVGDWTLTSQSRLGVLLFVALEHVAIRNLLLLTTFLLGLSSLLLLLVFLVICGVHTWNTPFAYWITLFRRAARVFLPYFSIKKSFWVLRARRFLVRSFR